MLSMSRKKFKNNQDGSAMVVVMCVMILVVALSLVLLLTASVMMMNAVRSNNKEQCRISALAVSDVLIEEIGNIQYDGSEEGAKPATVAEYLSQVPPNPLAHGKDSELKGKLKTVFTSAWKKYDTSVGSLANLNSKYEYKLGDGNDLENNGIPGITTVTFYWMADDLEIDSLNLTDPAKAQDAADLMADVTLYMNVTNTVGEESCTILSTFVPVIQGKKISKIPEITGEKPAEDPWIWTSWYWKYAGHTWEGGVS